jgi:hypothetical protein
MAETISPAVHGGRSRKYWRAVAVHVLGSSLAGAVLGLMLGFLGAALGGPWQNSGPLVVALVAAAYFLRVTAGLSVPLLHRRRQVPDWWRTFYSPAVSSFMYGIGLGAGFGTFASFGTFTAVAVAAAATGSPLRGAVLWGLFGAARGLAVLAGAGAIDAEQGAAVVDGLQRAASGRLLQALNAAALLTLAVTGAAAFAL